MPKPTKTLTRRHETDERAERILAAALRGRGGAITKADAVALTGLPAFETESALRTLLSRYRSHLDVTEQGELVYRFDPQMARRDAVPLGERLRQAGEALWRGFTFLFKIWIVATLVIYTIAFLLMMLALVFARSSGDGDSDDDGGGFGISPWLLWWLLPDFGPGYGDPYRARRMIAGRKRPDKRFYQSVFDYVFGPKGPPLDALAADKEMVAYIRDADGRITATDLVALTAWSYQRADEEITRLLVDYDGEPEVQDDGTIVYVFPSLRRTAGELAGAGRWSYAWGRSRALPALTGNTSGANTGITVMNGFNLVASLTLAPAFMQRFSVDPQLAVLLMAFPAAFSGIFYAVPALRAARRSRRQRRLRGETARALMLGEIVSRRGEPAAPDALVAAARRKAPVDAERARRALERLLVDLDGDVVTGDDGVVRYAFPRLGSELRAADTARRIAPAGEREIGQVVFSSEAEGSGEVLELPARPQPERLN